MTSFMPTALNTLISAESATHGASNMDDITTESMDGILVMNEVSIMSPLLIPLKFSQRDGGPRRAGTRSQPALLLMKRTISSTPWAMRRLAVRAVPNGRDSLSRFQLLRRSLASLKRRTARPGVEGHA